MKKIKVSILRIAVALASIIIIVLCTTWLPNIADYFEADAPEFAHLKVPLLLGIYSTAIPFFIAVFNVFKLLRVIEKDAVFTMDSIRYLSIISKCCIAVIALYILGLFYTGLNGAGQPGIRLLALAIMFTAFIIYIFIEILKELLIKAVEIKNENDLTV